MNNKSVSAATIGYMGYALILWVIGVNDSGLAHAASPAAFEAMMLPLVILLLVVGILGFTNGRVLDTVIFLGGAAVLWSFHSLHRPGVKPGFIGWFDIVWAAFFAWVFVAALKASLWRMLFLLGMWLWLLAGAIENWSAIHVIGVLSAYIELATAVLAAIVSASEINRHSAHLKAESGAADSASG